MTDLTKIKEDVNKQLASPQILNDLVNTTFRGLKPQLVKRAILEGVMRGFEFKDFLEKNVYAIPYGNEYSLVTSIDYARKIGMRSGIVGKSAPQFEEKDDKIVSCTVTVNRKVDDYVGDYTATVFFDEYSTGRNLWKSKPHTMIAKVAEMHALRMACPEEMSQMYVEEEYERGDVIEGDASEHKAEIANIDTIDELTEYWKKNRGKGKEFDKMVKDRKEQLEANQLTNEEKQEIINQEQTNDNT